MEYYTFLKMLQFLLQTTYTINNCPLSIATTQRDLGINVGIVQFSWSVHNNYILFSKVYRVLNLIRRTIPSVPHSLQRRYCLVCSNLSYYSQIWRPFKMKEICHLESVQRRATKFILSYGPLEYKSRLFQLGLLPLMYSTS